MKKLIPGLLMVVLFGSVAIPVFARPPMQTKQGCQTESSDYLVDVIWMEFGALGIYDLNATELRAFMAMLGIPPGDSMELFVELILADGTLVGYFGRCCFEGGKKTYAGPRDNTFPTGCCKPPDFETFPFSYVGGGGGNPCKCQSGLHPTPNGRTYGGDIITIGNSTFIPLNATHAYLLLGQMAPEEWAAIPVPFGP